MSELRSNMPSPAADGMHHCIATLQRNGVQVSADRAALLQRYVALLLEWNPRINLISRKDHGDIWVRHLLHSLAVLAVHPIADEGCYADVGSGGGLPGIPLSILLPNARFLLCDSVGKKMRAVEDMVAQLGLTNVRCLSGRVEELLPRLGPDGRCGTWLARAVAPLPDLVAWCLAPAPDCRPQRLLAWKGGDVSAEIAAARRLVPAATVEEMPIALAGESSFADAAKKLVIVTFS
jgi:16S rRNA (guanine527-N7)-methyltransferase